MSNADLKSDPLIQGVPEHEGYKVLGGVVLYQKLGQGGMGAVYRGRHLRGLPVGCDWGAARTRAEAAP